MNECSNSATAPSPMKRVLRYLQRASVARGLAYLGSAVLLRQAIGRFQPTYVYYDLERFHLNLTPFVAAMTYGFVQLRSEDRARWTVRSVGDAVAPALIGTAVGTGALLSFLVVGHAIGWIEQTGWGWEQTSALKLAGSVALIAIGQLALAWNEEMVFRGYSYSTLRLAAPAALVAPFLTVLFGYYHSYDPWVAWHEMAIGAPMLLLRLASGSIAASVGYHWAWNFVQSGVFGPTDSAPSLLPIRVHGPVRWVGRPGYPEPGWLSTIVSLSTAVGIGVWLYLQHRRRRAL